MKIYADFGSDPAALEAIRSFLGSYSRPDAQDYVPEKATLFLRPISEAVDVSVQGAAPGKRTDLGHSHRRRRTEGSFIESIAKRGYLLVPGLWANLSGLSRSLAPRRGLCGRCRRVRPVRIQVRTVVGALGIVVGLGSIGNE